jgi:hypothetical protein
MRDRFEGSLALAGVTARRCAVGPDYVAPPSAPPRDFMGAAAVASARRRPRRSTRRLVARLQRPGPRPPGRPRPGPEPRPGPGHGPGDPGAGRTVARPPPPCCRRAASRRARPRPMPRPRRRPGAWLSATPGFDRDGSLYEANLVAGWEIDVFGGLRRDQEAAVADYQAAGSASPPPAWRSPPRPPTPTWLIRGLQARLAVAREQVETQRGWSRRSACSASRQVASELQLHQAEGAWPRPRPAFRCWRRGSRRR